MSQKYQNEHSKTQLYGNDADDTDDADGDNGDDGDGDHDKAKYAFFGKKLLIPYQILVCGLCRNHKNTLVTHQRAT